MEKLIYAVSILMLAAITTRAQDNEISKRNFIEWNEFYDVQWHDFEGKPGSEAIGDAGTVVQIKAKPFMVKKKVTYDVTAIFVKDKSWATDKSDALLEHERLHFDIAELYARKIRKKIHELSVKNINDVKIYNAAINTILEESNAADIRYDMETLHGAMLKKQEAWAKTVHGQLLELESYKKHKRVVGSR